MSAAYTWIMQGNEKRRVVLAAFDDQPHSAAEIASKLALSRTLTLYHVNMLLACKPPALRVVGATAMPHGGRRAPLYVRTGADFTDDTRIVAFRPGRAKPETKRDVQRAEAYQIILAALAVRPMGDQDLADYLGRDRKRLARHTIKMHALRLIHVTGFRMPLVGGNARKLYAPGDFPDAVRVLKRDQRMSVEERRERRKADVLESLAQEGTVNEIALRVRTHNNTARKYIGELRASGQVRITGWRKGRGECGLLQVFGLGSDPDAPRPAGESRRSQSPERVRARQSKAVNNALNGQKGRALSDQKKRAAVAETIASAKARPHNIFAALGL